MEVNPNSLVNETLSNGNPSPNHVDYKTLENPNPKDPKPKGIQTLPKPFENPKYLKPNAKGSQNEL